MTDADLTPADARVTLGDTGIALGDASLGMGRAGMRMGDAGIGMADGRIAQAGAGMTLRQTRPGARDTLSAPSDAAIAAVAPETAPDADRAIASDIPLFLSED